MPKTKAAPEADLLSDVLALQPRLEAELADEAHRSAVVRGPLLNVLGAISQLKDSMFVDEAVKR